MPSGALKIVYPNSPEIYTIRSDMPFAPDTTKKPQRYFKPAGQPNRLYIPHMFDNIEQMPEILFVEGEMKALCGAILGLPTVAISWNLVLARR